MKKIEELFQNWEETLIWSCLQGVMGEICTNAAEDAAMACLGDFVFFAGNPSEELVRRFRHGCRRDFRILVPQNAAWAGLIEAAAAGRRRRLSDTPSKRSRMYFTR